MRTLRSRALSLTAVGAAVILTGCAATHASAVRVNSDGSVDYVTCVSDANDWYAVMRESSVTVRSDSYTPDEWQQKTRLPSDHRGGGPSCL